MKLLSLYLPYLIKIRHSVRNVQGVKVILKMHLYLYILLYFLVPPVSPKQIEVKCPEHCKCDFFEKLKRATCTHRNIVTVESNIPQQTQILDLSYNQISELGDGVFMEEKLVSLQLLNISHNKVGQIHMNAFQGLTQLKTLDLSYNGVQYILKNWFWSLQELEELYLRGNSFTKIDNEPLFASKTLKRLDFSHCRISFIGSAALSQLPSLETLDLSNNFLIHVDVATIQPLPQLTILNVQNNSLSCDGVLEKLSDYCTHQGIRFENPCKKKILETEKFQRMMNVPNAEDEKNSWIYDDQEEINDNTTKTIETCNNTHADKSLLQEIVDLSPVLSITIPFIYGIAVGVLIAYIVHTFSEKRQKDLDGSTYISFDEGESHLHRRNNTFNRRSARFSRPFQQEDRQSLRMQEWSLSESTPVLFRKNQVATQQI